MLNFEGAELTKSHQRELTRYIEQGTSPSGFVYYTLANDLAMAVLYASELDLQALPSFVEWLRYHAPESCYGTEAKVLRWMETHLAQQKGARNS
jgi:hypothetical protein